MPITSLLLFAAAYAVAVASPGPGMAAVVARGLGGGFRGALPVVFGILFGDLVFLTLAVFGLAAIAQAFGTVFLVIKYAGAAYLLYLAWKLWNAEPDPEQVRARAAEHPAKTLLAGLSLTLGNPKAMIFYLALLPTLIPLERLTLVGFLELAGIVAIVLLIVGSAYAAAAAGARELLKSPRALRRLNRTAGITMAGAAAAVVAR